MTMLCSDVPMNQMNYRIDAGILMIFVQVYDVETFWNVLNAMMIDDVIFSEMKSENVIFPYFTIFLFTNITRKISIK